MVKQHSKGRLLMLLVLALASIVFTGCEKGSLGLKGGNVTGYVLNSANNQPIPEVLIRANGTDSGGAKTTHTAYTKGDGSYHLSNMTSGDWTIDVEKYGYKLANQEEGSSDPAATIVVNNGEAVSAPVIRMTKTEELYRGTLRGYPVDGVTGRPVRNFTVTQTYPYEQRRSKLFEQAVDFRDSGWTGLDGGNHHYTISANNYRDYKTDAENPEDYISIGASPVNMGVIHMDPFRVSISGTLRNLPGYVLDSESRDIYIWAESAGRVVASFTSSGDDEALKGSINYGLGEIPVTAGSVAVKAKVRGYDLMTINPAVSIASTMPGGTIGGINVDFANVEPIRRDVRVVVTGNEPRDDTPSTFPHGNVARVYIKQGGRDIVPYVDVVSVNYRAEAYFSGVITGYPITILAVNMNAGYNNGESEEITIQEDGNTMFTIHLRMSKD